MQSSDFNHIYWIGGSPCGGKSTVAKMIANNCGLKLYSIDEELRHMMQNISPELQPALTQWEAQTWEERWLQPVDHLLDFVIRAYDEEFAMCIEEIKAIPLSQPTLVEGNPLHPEIVLSYLADKQHAIWLIASDDDLRHYYGQREWAQHVVKETSDPQRAFSNWMARDVTFANLVREACETNHLPYLMSDRQCSLEKKARQVAAHFQLPCD